MLTAVAVVILLAQTVAVPAPSLVEAQSLIDAGKLPEAETSIRAYQKDHPGSADGHYLLSYTLFRAGKPKQSLDEYAAAAALRPPGALDLQVAGCDRFLLEDYSGADELLTRSLAINPTDPVTLYFLGRTKYNEKRFEDAERSLAKCPTNPKAKNYQGLALEQLGRPEEAQTAYAKAIELDPNDADPRLNLGVLLTANQKAAEALPHLVKAAQLKPDDFEVHRALGKAYLDLHDLKNTQAEFERASSLSPGNAPIHFLLAEVYRKQGLADKAAAETSTFVSLTGGHSSPDSPLQEARTLVEMNKISEAEQVARRYLSTHKNSAAGHFLLGYILFKKQDATASLAEYTEGAKYGTPSAADLQAVAADYVLLKDYLDADKWFSKALEWNPNDALGWYYLGRTKYNENRFVEAIAAFEKSLALEPKSVKAKDNLGLSLEGLNRADEAAGAYRQAIEWQAGLPIRDSGPYLNLGSLLVETGHPTDALIHLREAERISPNDYRVHRALGKAYSHTNELEKAVVELERAAALAPGNAPVHFMLAQVYRKQGLAEKARIENERYLSLAASNPPSEN